MSFNDEKSPQTPRRQTNDHNILESVTPRLNSMPLQMQEIPSLQPEDDYIPQMLPPRTTSPSSIRSKRTSFSGSPIYKLNNSSSGSVNNKKQSTSLNYVPSLTQPPPPITSVNVPAYYRHSPSNSQASNKRSRSPIRSKSPIRSPSPIRAVSPIRGANNPFNYKSTTLMMHSNGSLNSLNVPSSMVNKTQYRRGHRYKHSSVSMNLFQEPPKRAPLNVPQNFSIPNFKEVLKSLAFEQKTKLGWCLIHISLVVSIFAIGLHYNNSLLLTLSHLCFYDVLSNLIVVIVDVMTNFECWNNSSLQYPFGLGRIEVLLGFGLSVSLIFVGGDLISHLLEELIIHIIMGNSDDGEGRVHHSHGEAGDDALPGFYFELLIFLIISTSLISSNYLLPSSSTSANFGIFNKNYLINSSTNFLTLIFASYSLLYPLISKFQIFESVNDVSTLGLAVLICMMAWRLIKSLSHILLISFPYDTKSFNKTISKLTDEIQNIDGFRSDYKIEKIVVSKVNYKIFIIIVQLQMFGSSDEDESKIRFYTTRLIRKIIRQEESGLESLDDTDNNFNDSNDQLGSKLEITIDIDRF